MSKWGAGGAERGLLESACRRIPKSLDTIKRRGKKSCLTRYIFITEQSLRWIMWHWRPRLWTISSPFQRNLPTTQHEVCLRPAIAWIGSNRTDRWHDGWHDFLLKTPVVAFFYFFFFLLPSHFISWLCSVEWSHDHFWWVWVFLFFFWNWFVSLC